MPATGRFPQPIAARDTRTGPASFLNDDDSAARRSLAALEAPRKTAEHDLLVEHLVDPAAQVLDVDDVVRKKQCVHDLVVGLQKHIVQAAAELLLSLLRL